MRVRSPSPRGCAYSEHAFYSAGSAAWATGSRGTSREVGMMWAGAALRTATGRLIRHVSCLSHQMLMLARRAYTNYYPHHALSRSVELSEPPVSGVCGMRDHASTDQDVRLRVSRHEFSISIAYIQRERVSVPRHACVPHMTSRPSPNDYLFLLTCCQVNVLPQNFAKTGIARSRAPIIRQDLARDTAVSHSACPACGAPCRACGAPSPRASRTACRAAVHARPRSSRSLS